MLTETIPQQSSLVATLQVYDWTTAALLYAWPVALGRSGGGGLVAHGRLAAVAGPVRLHLVDLTTGKDVSVGPASVSRPALGSRGLVYAVNRSKGADKIVFVPTAKLLALVG